MLLHSVVSIFILSFIVIFNAFYWNHKRKHKKEFASLIDLHDAPFKFRVASEEHTDYAVFEFSDDTTLWCVYSFGIKSDGVYGINDLKIVGLNSLHGGTIRLKVGQSVFPVISNMDLFQDWAKTKAFACRWERNFEDAWEDMIKKLDNLRVLETKSKEKDKKSK
jgi:hypothetical protein